MIHMEMLCDPKLIPDTALYLSKIAENCGVTEQKAYKACFVIEMILEMRMEEADRNDPVILLDVKREINELLVSITDRGLPYVLTGYQKTILKKGLVDRFFFEQLGKEGQRITVAFRISGENSEMPALSVPEKEEIWTNSDFSCRPTKEEDEDIVQAIRCIYTSYGYNYIHQELYNVDIFRSMLQSGRYISVLSENADGQVAGHIAIEEHRWFPGIMEVCNLVVKPTARGKDISGSLVKSIVQTGKKKDLCGLYAMPAMFHPISQRLSTENGFYPCGMYFHLLGGKTTGEYGDGSERLSAAFAVHIYDTETVHTLCLPEACAEFVQDIFDVEKMRCTAGSVSAAGAPAAIRTAEAAKTSLSYTIDTLSRRLEIKIDTAGEDLEKSLKDLFFREEIIEVVMVYLNANDPGCPAAYRLLREMGLIFTGCLPGSRTNDYLLLQHLKGRPAVGNIFVAEPDYKRMLDRLNVINGMQV